jgi:hypothetical protein
MEWKYVVVIAILVALAFTALGFVLALRPVP